MGLAAEVLQTELARRQDKEELERLLAEKLRRKERRKIEEYYPAKGPLRRELYPKHLGFMAAGKRFRERAFRAAHRVGKTEGTGGYELALHLTGRYPDWWEGRRFEKGIRAWASGDTNQTTRDILQTKLMGPMEGIGTGLIPGDTIKDWKRKATSVPDTIETVWVKHVSGGVSVLGFKSFEQGKKAFYGTEQDVILLDEEPSMDIYTQCLIRTMTTNGLVMLTFTPLLGMSEVVMEFMPEGKEVSGEETGKFIIGATWDDAPHLTEKAKKELWGSIPVRLRDAMTKGIPALGSGAIYPIGEEAVTTEDFEIPDHFPRAYALDVGWNCTAALWGAWDLESDVLYCYSEYKSGEELPVVHTEAIKARGEWIPGVDDPGAWVGSMKDGEALHKEYTKLGLVLSRADARVETGIHDVWMGLNFGRIKLFKSLVRTLEEFRLYRRDDKGKIVKENDHLMDDLRYLHRSGPKVRKVMPPEVWKLKALERAGVLGERGPGGIEESVLFFGLSEN